MPYKCPEKRKDYLRKYYEVNSKRIKSYVTLSRYSITQEDYDEFLENQNFCCAVCGKHSDEFSKPLYIDHDHTTGKIRGLLCNGCNAGIGMLGDNIEGLEKAISYLKGEFS